VMNALGISDEEGHGTNSVIPAISVGSINVTCLTAARLRDVLREAQQKGDSFVVLQETRHHDMRCGWIRRIACEHGWNAACSAPPALTNRGCRGQGGTAVLWRKGMGKASIEMFHGPEDHRQVAIRVAGFLVVSVYGPSVKSDQWFQAHMEWVGRLGGPMVLLGDYNWVRSYQNMLLPSLITTSIGPTTVAGTTPTRCFSDSEVTFCGTTLVPGIPHHGHAQYSIRWVLPERKPSPLRRTACFQWPLEGDTGMRKEFTEEQNVEARAWVDDIAPSLGGDLLCRWHRWHLRAETFMQFAASRGMARQTCKPERSKGSLPTSRPTASGPSHHRDEPIRMRRLRRFGRRLAERLRQGADCCEMLPARDQQAMGRLDLQGLWSDGAAYEAIGREITNINADMQRQACSRWTNQFRNWSRDTVQAAKGQFRPRLAPLFTAREMRQEWEPVWCTPGQADLAEWQGIADRYVWPQSAWPRDWQPSLDSFRQAVRATDGSAGLDGWSSTEGRILELLAPWLVEEVYGLWVETASTPDDDIPQELKLMLWGWRVAGIPKPATDESRPISVGSIWLRAWHRALLEAFPEPPRDQWCGRKGCGVITATADFLARKGRAGAELDLSKAFDTLDHRLLAEALTRANLPCIVSRELRRSWEGPRVIHTNGEVAQALWPKRGVPQGGACCPNLLSLVLAPWNPVDESEDSGNAVGTGIDMDTNIDTEQPHDNHDAPQCKWLYMDDRTLSTHGNTVDAAVTRLDTAITNTERFDRAAGVLENAKKRQRWREDQMQRIEHLGLSLVPGDPRAPILPRGGREKLMSGIHALARLPGSACVRERLASTFILPRVLWASPLQSPPPPQVADALRHASRKTGCTWHCTARWWAERVTCHPVYASAVQSIKVLARGELAISEHLIEAGRRHAAVLGLTLIPPTPIQIGSGWMVQIKPGDDARAAEAFRLARERCAARPKSITDEIERRYGGDHTTPWMCPTTPVDFHALRVISRIRLFQRISGKRHDSEGHHDVDIEAQSNHTWKQWRQSLPVDSARLLRTWRSGGLGSATRRARSVGDLLCPLCTAALGSWRHSWQECEYFHQYRVRLSEQYSVPYAWYSQQPRITAASGWITRSAGPSIERRAMLQIMSCELAIHVASTVLHALDAPPAGA